ncbi:hypothetical protein [Streptomyces heilongjiangensis]|uniref:FXSXX-COOH protein n=1 Tax=Streptomyces heilongjiangensis TaxID=945052 RepID=A0ABW1B3Y5_9ACTN|nr:hypothetical protein [Streptomyces heilongjiangensis]MDC2948277.1 hypothetical protein [Streptomyces heilongjiangensis]
MNPTLTTSKRRPDAARPATGRAPSLGQIDARALHAQRSTDRLITPGETQRAGFNSAV